MGARGPAPKDGSVTRHPPKQQPKNMEAAPPDVPKLAEFFPSITFLPQTLAWWDAWVSSPQADYLAGTDWQTLLRLAPLVDAFFVEPTAQRAAEIRQTEAKLGGTVSDRDRLGWKISPPPEPPADGARGSRSRPDPRKPKEAK